MKRFLFGAAGALCLSIAHAVPPAAAQVVEEELSPYRVERSWPDYFLEHRKLFTEKAGT